MNDLTNLLILAPHPDDGEFSSGGTLKKLTSNGVKVWYIAFSPCVKSLPDGSPRDTLFIELYNAIKHIGIAKDNVITFDFPVREFDKHRQEILEELVKLKREIKPGLVLLPNSKDIHQDHQVIYNEGIRAFKHSKILGYELPWNNLEFVHNFYCKLEEGQIEAKYAAIQEYKSQSFRQYHSKEFFYGLAKARGTEISCEFAEAFELIRWYI